MRHDMVPGAVFPDYELSDHTAKRRTLSERQGQHPMVLVLSRGGYCPKDRRQAERLLELHREMEVGYCRLVTISTDNITETNEYRTGVGAHWPFLSDTRRIVQKDLDIPEYTDPAHNPMIPHVIVLEPGLVIYKIYMGYWYWGPPPPNATSVLAIGFDRDELARFCTDPVLVTRLDNHLALHNAEQGAPVWSCTTLRAPWKVLWPELKVIA